eukprot:gb/GECG01010783.1/.p1 GENE.gb/GECG01010783.1/~~gb/GECG01010783.1/.p1  ORF type:complete len:466 (+),score=61.80 gb/GECG01010783.1/:1-1398(+)
MELPPPLIPYEEGQSSFTYKSVFDRLPRIVDSVLRNHGVPQEVCDRFEEFTANNRQVPRERQQRSLLDPMDAETLGKELMATAGESCRLESKTVAGFLQLKRDIVTDSELVVPAYQTEEKVAPSLSTKEWEGYLLTYRWYTSAEPIRWSTAPWFVSENYMYFRIMKVARLSGLPEFAQDPFQVQKQQALVSAESAYDEMIHTIENTHETRRLRLLLLRSLWGNRADLSLSAGAASDASHKETSSLESTLLANDTSRAVTYLRDKLETAEPQVSIMLDNCGLELLSDLIFSEFLVQNGAVVTLHCKESPTFVSDATETDVFKHLEWIEGVPSKGKEIASRIRTHLSSRKLCIKVHPFYNSPCPMWDIPSDVAGSLEQMDLCILKGDANYRRLLGDRKFRATEPFRRVAMCVPSKATLALRTCKSDVLIGADEKAIQTAEQQHCDRQWLTNGQYGIVSFWENKGNEF